MRKVRNEQLIETNRKLAVIGTVLIFLNLTKKPPALSIKHQKLKITSPNILIRTYIKEATFYVPRLFSIYIR